ncbi:protein translocase subunit SecF [Candidatus Babela massiliensis]|uniref:Protein-export membrane protein SecF n=1 Tax=Candidatus Babela massiliensis TaxID=673862 RepID=V6DH17_9BACT|nr:protein translocase subunit SecF [Candidatus Babela massiliensis]CDK30855.1 Preprotein translocase subunit SecF [Candidatus Babela massiliensis]
MFNFLRYSNRQAVEHPIDFMKYNWLSLILSALLIFTFSGFYLYRYFKTGSAFNYSVDFTGGIQTLLKFNKPVKSQDIIRILDEKGWPGTIAREFSEKEQLIRIKKEAKDVKEEAENIKKAIEASLDNSYKVEILKTDSVGGATGSRLWLKSFYAIVLSLIAMLLYIAFRFFSFSYAMGAVVSLFHDALAILTVFLIFDKEISINVIGAILAVLGYSINDTIVIFSRVKDNIKKYPNKSIREVINISITETLSRTILTTISTLLVVVSLSIFGGETLRDLSLALLVGIVFGIYSTIFIANPVLLLLYKDNKVKK